MPQANVNLMISLIATETGGSVIIASGLTGKTFETALRGTEEIRHLQVLQLLGWMCREYARCLHTLKQAAVEHKCASIGQEEIKESHTELMAMQLERESFLLFLNSQIYEVPFISAHASHLQAILLHVY